MVMDKGFPVLRLYAPFLRHLHPCSSLSFMFSLILSIHLNIYLPGTPCPPIWLIHPLYKIPILYSHMSKPPQWIKFYSCHHNAAYTFWFQILPWPIQVFPLQLARPASPFCSFDSYLYYCNSSSILFKFRHATLNILHLSLSGFFGASLSPLVSYALTPQGTTGSLQG